VGSLRVNLFFLFFLIYVLRLEESCASKHFSFFLVLRISMIRPNLI